MYVLNFGHNNYVFMCVRITAPLCVPEHLHDSPRLRANCLTAVDNYVVSGEVDLVPAGVATSVHRCAFFRNVRHVNSCHRRTSSTG